MKAPTPRQNRVIRVSTRLALAACALAAALIYLLPVAATSLIGQEELRAHAQAALASALQRQVEIRGGVRLSMLPWFGLRAGDVVVANTPGFGDAPLMAMDSAAIGLNLAALLDKRVVVDSIALGAASLKLARDAAGRDNWSPARTLDQSRQVPGGWRVETLPTGLNLTGASLSYSDAATGLSLDVSELDLKTSPSRPFQFSLSCKVKAAPWGVSGEIHAQGLGSYGAGGVHVYVHQSRAAGYLDLPPSPGMAGGRVMFSGKVTVHGEGGAFEVAEMALEGLGARVTGQVNAAGLYEPTPYVHLDLAAKASREGAWTKLLGLSPPSGEESASAGPELRRPSQSGAVEAELVFGSTPAGWIVRKALLRDGGAVLSGTARHAEGELEFDISADGLDLGRWFSARRPALPAASAPPRTVKGRITGRDLSMGLVHIARLELNAHGRDGQVRIYPFTAKTTQALITTDLRIAPSGDAPSFSGSSRIQALPPDALSKGPPVTMAGLSVSGRFLQGGLSGSMKLDVASPGKGWTPPWLTEKALKAWSILGGGSISCSVDIPGGGAGAWKLSAIDARTQHSHLTGSAQGSGGRTFLDIQADHLDLDRMSLLSSVWGGSLGGYAPWPVEARVAARRLTTGGVPVDDLLMAFTASPDSLRFSTISGAVFGGRFNGGIELEDKAGRRSLAAALTVGGMQAAQLSALRPGLPRLSGPLEGRISLEARASGGEPLWQALNGQAEIALGRGSFAFASGQGASTPWPVAKASALFKASVRRQAAPRDGHGDEAALADIAGTVRVESPGVVRSTRLEVKGQAGLSASGEPLWYRQPRVDGEHEIEAPFVPKGRTAKASWNGRFEADFDKGTFSAAGLELSLAGVPGRGSLSGRPGKDGMELSGVLDIPEFDPRQAAQRLGFSIPAGADPNMWKRARFQASLGGGPREIRLEKIQASLDESVITGQARISGQANRLDLTVSTLDLDRLAPAPQYPDPARRPEEAVPLDELRELSLDARVRFGWLRKDRLIFQNALTEFTAQGGRFQLRQSAPDFYGGAYAMLVRGDARGPELKGAMELTLSGFRPGPLLRDLAGSDSISQGRGDFWVKVESRGNTDRRLRKMAAGTAGFEVRGGVLGIKDAPPRQPPPPAGLTGERDAPPPPAAPAEGLAFSRLGASFTVREGLAVTRDFSLTGKQLSAKGDGWVSLDDERIDLSLVAAVPDVGDVPVRISGPLYDPRLDVDKSKVIGDTLLNIFKGVFSIPGSVIMQLRRVF